MQVWKVLHAARCKCRTQKVAKNRHLGTIPQLCLAISSQLRHVSTIGKKLVKQQYLLYMFSQYGELRPTEIVSLVWGTPANFNWFRVLASLLHGTLVVGDSQTAALNRGRHLCSAGRPSRWALAHILVWYFLVLLYNIPNLYSHNCMYIYICNNNNNNNNNNKPISNAPDASVTGPEAYG